MEDRDQGRRIFRTRGLAMRLYGLRRAAAAGNVLCAPVYDAATGRGSYLIRMEPGSATIPHEHASREEFMILGGEAIEDDGTVLRPGDWIAYDPGSSHSTRTVAGCLLLGLDWDPGSRT